MYKRVCSFFFFIVCLGAIPSRAQKSAPDLEIMNVVRQLFKGMELGDSAKVRETFSNTVTMATLHRDNDNKPVIRYEASIDDFLQAVGTPHPKVWYEEIWNEQVRIDGDFAQVWCDYAFYIDHTFSHCGVDAFHLHRDDSGWKIFHLADTRRSTDCNIPKNIEKKHNH